MSDRITIVGEKALRDIVNECDRLHAAVASERAKVKALRGACVAVDEWLMFGFDDKDADNEVYNVQFRKALRLVRAALAATSDPIEAPSAEAAP